MVAGGLGDRLAAILTGERENTWESGTPRFALQDMFQARAGELPELQFAFCGPRNRTRREVHPGGRVIRVKSQTQKARTPKVFNTRLPLPCREAWAATETADADLLEQGFWQEQVPTVPPLATAVPDETVATPSASSQSDVGEPWDLWEAVELSMDYDATDFDECKDGEAMLVEEVPGVLMPSCSRGILESESYTSV
jgi:hypothetical protein